MCVCVCVIMSGVLDQIDDRLCLWKIIYLLTFGYEVVTCDPQKLPNSHRLHCQLGCVRVWQVSHRLHCQLGCVRAWQVDRLGGNSLSSCPQWQDADLYSHRYLIWRKWQQEYVIEVVTPYPQKLQKSHRLHCQLGWVRVPKLRVSEMCLCVC